MGKTMNEITVGSRVTFHSRNPFHMHHGVVIGEDPKADNWGVAADSWIVRWDGDQYFPERAGTESRIPKYVALEVR